MKHSKISLAIITASLALTACSSGDGNTSVINPTSTTTGNISHSTNKTVRTTCYHNMDVCSRTEVYDEHGSEILNYNYMFYATDKDTLGVDHRYVNFEKKYTDNLTGVFDAGLNGLKNGEITNKVFSGLKVYTRPNAQAYLIDPAAAGFQYQTFGQIFGDNNRLQSHVTLGITYIPKDNEVINATYKGGAIGIYDNRSQVVSDMDAALKWNTNEKSLTVTLSNSKISTDNAINNAYTALKPDSRFNIKTTMDWNEKYAEFLGWNGSARMYGANDASEIGGVIDKTIDGKDYRAAFGGVKK